MSRTSWPRLLGAALALSLVVGVIVLAFLWPAATSSVKALPIGVVGEAAAVGGLESALEQRAPGTFDVRELDDRDAATDAIESREIYGAIVLAQQPEVLVSSAASPVASQLLSGLAPVLQAQLNAMLAEQGMQPPAPIVVEVHDIVPLSDSDSRGAVLGASSFPLVLGGMLGGIAISIAVVGVWRRVAAVLLYSAAAGAVIAGILQGWFGALQGDALVNAAAIALAVLAISGVIVGFASLFGRPGIAVGPVVFLLFANPISAAVQPIEFLAEPWGAVGQWFPPGAAATLLRELSYFPEADVAFSWLVLGAWAIGGLVLAAVGHFRDRAAGPEPVTAPVGAPEPVATP